MYHANMHLVIFQETKLTDGVYTHGSAGYSVIATEAPIRNHSGVAVFYHPSPRYAVEDIQKFGPNIIGFQLAMGERRWYIIKCYLAPDDTSMIESAVAVLMERP